MSGMVRVESDTRFVENLTRFSRIISHTGFLYANNI